MNKIPITVGVIGHLDAIITENHKNKIAELFNDIYKQYPNSPVTLFSQLVKGAGTEVAKQFIEIKEKTNRDYNLIVPLPFKESDYKKTFSKKELVEYDSLISKAERHFVIDNSDKYDDIYRESGQFVADSSIILIAIWDEDDKKCGTSEIVKYKIESSFKGDKEHIFGINESLISLPCNRTNSNIQSDISLENNQLKKLLKDKSIEKALKKIDTFNKKLNRIKPYLLEESSNYLYPKDKPLTKPNKILRDYYSIVDIQSIIQKKKYNNLILLFFITGFYFLITFEIYEHLGLNQFLLYGAVGLVVVAWFIFKFAPNWCNRKQYIENRIIAEALRVQLSWNIDNIKESVSKYILRIHKTEYNWGKHILSSIYGLTYNAQNTENKTIEEAKNARIISELEFFNDRLEELSDKKGWFVNWSIIFFVIGLLTLVGIFVLHIEYDHHFLLHPLILFDSILFGAFALIKAYDHQGKRILKLLDLLNVKSD